MFKTKEALIPYLLLVAAMAAGLIWHESETVPGLGRTVISGQIAVGGPFALIDQNGDKRTSKDFHGKYQLIYFGYTFCPDVCPTTLSAMALALDKLGPLADKVQPVFITVDPERDTAKIVGEYVKDFDPRFVGLVGSPQEIGTAAEQFHVYYRVRQLGNNEYVVDHSSFIYLIDPNGAFVRLLTGDLPGHQLADELRKLMS